MGEKTKNDGADDDDDGASGTLVSFLSSFFYLFSLVSFSRPRRSKPSTSRFFFSQNVVGSRLVFVFVSTCRRPWRCSGGGRGRAQATEGREARASRKVSRESGRDGNARVDLCTCRRKKRPASKAERSRAGG